MVIHVVSWSSDPFAVNDKFLVIPQPLIIVTNYSH